jgi:hypothetical protein
MKALAWIRGSSVIFLLLLDDLPGKFGKVLTPFLIDSEILEFRFTPVGWSNAGEAQRRFCPRMRHTGGCRKRPGNSGHQVWTSDRSGRNRRKGWDVGMA